MLWILIFLVWTQGNICYILYFDPLKVLFSVSSHAKSWWGIWTGITKSYYQVVIHSILTILFSIWKHFITHFCHFRFSWTNQPCLKSYYSRDPQRRNIVSMYNLIHSDNKQQKLICYLSNFEWGQKVPNHTCWGWSFPFSL